MAGSWEAAERPRAKLPDGSGQNSPDCRASGRAKRTALTASQPVRASDWASHTHGTQDGTYLSLGALGALPSEAYRPGKIRESHAMKSE